MNPTRVTAAGNGAMSFFYFNGVDTRYSKPFIYVETIGGGSGARYNKDGLDAVQVHMTNTSNLPVEALEMEYPLMVERYALHENSCGPGKFRGGLRIIRSIRIPAESKNTVLPASTERYKRRPWGLAQGGCGGNSSLKIYRNGEVISSLAKPRNVPLQTGDVVDLITAGGGGYGRIEEQDAKAVQRDYIEVRSTTAGLKTRG